MKTNRFLTIVPGRVGMFCYVLCCVGCALHGREQQVVGARLHALCRAAPRSAGCLQHMVQLKLLSVPAGPALFTYLELLILLCLESYCICFTW